TDHNQAALPLLGRLPGPIELTGHARADRLHQQPQRLAGYRGKALHAQHVETLGERFNTRDERRWIGEPLQPNDKAIEIVMIVLGFGVVPGRAIGNVVFSCDAEPQQQLLIDLPSLAVSTLTFRGSAFAIAARARSSPPASNRSRLFSMTRSAQAI